MNEMDRLTLDLGHELGERIEAVLPGSPVVLAPICGQAFEVAGRYAAIPPDAGQVVVPPGPAQAVAKVVDVGLRDIDPERADRLCTRHGLTVGSIEER